MPPLTAILIAQNEELDLPQALRSLESIADEIILVDSGSTDRTREVAQEFGARVYQRKLDSLADQKNFAASFASHDWLLSIDCDEVLSPQLRASLLCWKQGIPDKPGYRVSRLTNYLGGWIRHSGWYPDYKVKLYHRAHGKFVNALHEDVQLDGAPGLLSGDLLHFTARTFAEHQSKLDVFSTLAAHDLHARGRKQWRSTMLFAPPWTFMQRIIFQRGILDGGRGWIIAWMSAKYIYLKYRKLGRLRSGETLERRSWTSPGEV